MTAIFRTIFLLTLLTLTTQPLYADADLPAQSNSAAQDEAIEESLENAEEHFLNALKALGEAGRKSYDKHLPKLKEQSEEALGKSREMIEAWQNQLKEMLDRQRDLNQERKKALPPRHYEPEQEISPRI
ncbi:MAG: hypothetical protein HQL67_04620 [Magnetococcales bacterium]|nr:hypothetical protein [Magnetococcales bacterium]